MVDWKEYRIIEVENNSYSGWIRFYLDSQVKYGNGGFSHIDFGKIFPFTNWFEGDKIYIDIDKTKAGKNCNTFYLWDNIVSQCNSRYEDKYWELKNKVSELEESNSNTQLVLRRSAETDKNNLEIAKRGLEIRVGDLERSNWSLQSTNNGLQEDLRKRNEDIKWGKDQLEIVQRSEREKQTKIDELTRQLNALQITNNNINREIQERRNEIRNLKGELNVSREEFLNQKIGLKEEELETLIQQLGINRVQITNLRNAYQQLINSRTNFNQININVAQVNINNIRTALLNGGVSVANTQKLCRKCEKLVKMEIELNQIYQQQYEARQEVPPRNN